MLIMRNDALPLCHTRPDASQVIRDKLVAAEDQTPNAVQCERNRRQISRLSHQPISWVDKMLVDRSGQLPDSAMQTHGLHTMVERDRHYRVSAEHGLQATDTCRGLIDLEQDVIDNSHSQPPPHASFIADWDTRVHCSGGSENALGDNGLLTLVTHKQILNVPLIDAERSALLYYGATLVNNQAVVCFPNDSYAIWHVGIGENYIDSFLMSDKGKGFYLEYHNDRPHWHQPLAADCGGVYILARQVGCDAIGQSRYHISGFKIPYGTGLYTGKSAIHCDPGLTGQHWLIGYDESDDFSTVVIRNLEEKMVRLAPTLSQACDVSNKIRHH